MGRFTVTLDDEYSGRLTSAAAQRGVQAGTLAAIVVLLGTWLGFVLFVLLADAVFN